MKPLIPCFAFSCAALLPKLPIEGNTLISVVALLVGFFTLTFLEG